MKAWWEGFGERIKRLNPIRVLGTGMNLGSLNDHAFEISMALLLDVFSRELQDSPERTRPDMLQSVWQILQDMRLEASENQVVRIVDGILWSGVSELQRPFTVTWFDETEKRNKEQTFRYLIEDREYSNWEQGGKTVYRLSDEAHEIIFMSREFLEELTIDLEQWYAIQLIKRGNYRKALSSLDTVFARVKRLIRLEMTYQEDIRRDPKAIYYEGQSSRQQRSIDVKQQFQEEQERFNEMLRIVKRLDAASDVQLEITRLQEKIQQNRQLHDQLAQLVLQNMALEVELRVKFPHLFWRKSNLSFKRNLWEEWILPKGLPNPEGLVTMLAPLFSPQQDFLFPMEWVWTEQNAEAHAAVDTDDVPLEEEEEYERHQIDWEKIADLWEPILNQLVIQGEYSLSDLRGISPEEQAKWLEQKEAFDLWLMFKLTSLTVPEDMKLEDSYHDERLVLIQTLLKRSPHYQLLEGKRLYAKVAENEPDVTWKSDHLEGTLTAYTLHLKEDAIDDYLGAESQGGDDLFSIA